MKNTLFLSLCAACLLTSCSLQLSSEPTDISPEITPVNTEITEGNTVIPTIQSSDNSADPSTNPTPTTPTTTYTIAEVSQHSTGSDCWLILDNSVYDVTSFIPRHPGGNAILSWCGKDATRMFAAHPASAKELKEQFKIGELMQ